MPSLAQLARIAEVEFSSVVVDTVVIGSKLRLLLTDRSYVDVWVSQELRNRFGFHWERRHLDGLIFRYDNFPDVRWQHLDTAPFHFHNGAQDQVEATPFAQDVLQGFRDFLAFVVRRISLETASER